MAEILSLEDGIKEAIRQIDAVENTPRLVAVYGYPDSGKSYLIHKVADFYKEKGQVVLRGSCSPSETSFEMIRDYPEEHKDEIHMFHFGGLFYVTEEGLCTRLSHDDPNALSRSILSRDMDVNIAIFNPKIYSAPVFAQGYDIAISNPDSVRKPNGLA